MSKQTDHVPQAVTFSDDGVFPNSSLPVLIYREAMKGTGAKLAARFEETFASNHWTESWRNGIYSFPHYHSTAHEVLAVFSGSASVQLGGPDLGRPFTLLPGDVIVIPAGVAHQNLGSTDDFKVVGAYAGGRKWDLLEGHTGERPQADRNIAEVPLPRLDPLFGSSGALSELWLATDESAFN